MTPILCVLLCLGLCLNQSMRTQEDGPSLSSDMGSLVPLGRNVTLRCRGSLKAENYTLGKEQESDTVKIIEEKPAGGEVEFLIPTVTAKDAGKYYCSYRCSSGQLEPGAALELVVTSLHDAPSLSAWPSSQVTPGQQVTLQCHSEQGYNSSALYKDGREMEKQGAQPQGRGTQANFSILAGNPGGTYWCYSFNSNNPYEWSAPSDPLVLSVSGTTKDPQLPQSSGEPQDQTSSPPSIGTTKDSHLPDSPGNPQTPTPSQPEISPAPKSGHSQVGIFIGISVFLILLILFLLFLRSHRRRQRQTRLRNGGKEEAKKTPRSSDPAGTPLEETQYAVVNKDRQTEEARPEDMAVSPRKDTQEVTYTQLDLSSLKTRVKDPTTSGSQDPTVYAALQ